jgi:hypothetical protein
MRLARGVGALYDVVGKCGALAQRAHSVIAMSAGRWQSSCNVSSIVA